MMEAVSTPKTSVSLYDYMAQHSRRQSTVLICLSKEFIVVEAFFRNPQSPLSGQEVPSYGTRNLQKPATNTYPEPVQSSLYN
jgi:hypothetical protein